MSGRRKRRPVAPSASAGTGTGSLAGKFFPIVGVGASAGGLEAFSTLLANLPESTGMAFVFLQHLDPSHTSALQEILSRTTPIPVVEATEQTILQKVIPPERQGRMY